MLKKILTAFALLAVSVIATAADGEKAARDAIHSMLPMAIIDQVVKSDLPGFYEVIISGQIVYVTEDGKYLLQGKLYDVPQKKDLTSARVAVMREQALAKLPESKEMIFAPPNPKHVVTVFTDVDCPYCRQFHKQITEYNRLGIVDDCSFAFLSAGTDGQDGPTLAAGAVINDTNAILDANQLAAAHDALNENNSFQFFAEYNDGSAHLMTGPTGTNVMDIQCVVLCR